MFPTHSPAKAPRVIDSIPRENLGKSLTRAGDNFKGERELCGTLGLCVCLAFYMLTGEHRVDVTALIELYERDVSECGIYRPWRILTRALIKLTGIVDLVVGLFDICFLFVYSYYECCDMISLVLRNFFLYGYS